MAETRERVIFVVDDNADHRRGFRVLLESGGYSVVECKSGKEALTALAKKNFDLMTLDLSMPDVDGFEVLRVVRSKHPELKVVVVSGFLQGSMNQAAKALGAVVTLDKNVAADSLLTVVDGLLKNPK
jgi:CheY-like chemotaxis protein